MLPPTTIPLAEIGPVLVAIFELVPITAAVIFYWHRAMNLSWAGRPVPAWRQASFGFGLFLACFVLFNPWGELADQLVIAHMVEHLLLADFAAFFIVLGLTRSILQPILAIPFFFRLQILANPFVALPLWAINLFFWHIPAMYDAAYGGAFMHGLEHTLFLALGCLMWMPVFGPLPTPSWFGPGWRIVYVVIVRFVAAILGNILMWTQVTLYQNYNEGHVKFGITAIQDQSTAGVIMMVEGTFLILGILAWTFFEAAKRSMQKQELMDLAYERGVEIGEDRIARAVTAGHAKLLEERIKAGKVGKEGSRDENGE